METMFIDLIRSLASLYSAAAAAADDDDDDGVSYFLLINK